jgi:hypothetical protein
MNRLIGFWVIWITFTFGIICFYYAVGMLDSVDIGKSIILTISVMLPVIPIKSFVKSNNELFHD